MLETRTEVRLERVAAVVEAVGRGGSPAQSRLRHGRGRAGLGRGRGDKGGWISIQGYRECGAPLSSPMVTVVTQRPGSSGMAGRLGRHALFYRRKIFKV